MIRAATKRLIRTRYAFRCGYCGVSETEVGAELTYDHFHPVSKGGTDAPDNLVYACHACNEFKGDYYSDSDSTRLLDPIRDDLTRHLVEKEGCEWNALTPLGRIFIERLHLNRPQLIARRVDRSIIKKALELREEEMRLQQEILEHIRALRRRQSEQG